MFKTRQNNIKLRITIPVEDVELLELSFITDGNVKWCNYFGKQFVSFSVNTMYFMCVHVKSLCCKYSYLLIFITA